MQEKIFDIKLIANKISWRYKIKNSGYIFSGLTKEYSKRNWQGKYRQNLLKNWIICQRSEESIVWIRNPKLFNTIIKVIIIANQNW